MQNEANVIISRLVDENDGITDDGKENKWLQRTLLASALLMAGPLSSASAAVVTSIRPLGFIASAIADGVTPTEVLLPDGASPHDFALRPSDIQRLRSADPCCGSGRIWRRS